MNDANSTPLSPDDAILSLDGLAKTFRVGFWGRPVQALRGVSLTMRRGESLGYLGPNGSGKTTSIKCIVGLIQASAGKVQLFGGDPGEAPRRAKVGYLPESPYFYDYLTPIEVMEYVGKLYGMSARDRAERSHKLLGQVGLDQAAKRPLRGFSKGMLQRVGIAQSLLADPELLIWDEPLSGLDPMGRKEVRDIMAALRADGKSLFFSSHVLSDIETLCDSVCILDRGQAVAQGRLSDLLRSEELESEAVAEIPSGDNRPAAIATLAALPGVVLTDLPSGVRLVLPTAQVPALMAKLLELGGFLRELNQRRDSLEELFLRKAVKRDQDGGAA